MGLPVTLYDVIIKQDDKTIMRKWIWLISLVMSLFTSFSFAADKVLVLNINGPIGPATQNYVQRGLVKATREHASVVVMQFDTSGGLSNSVNHINKLITKSTIPVITYTDPVGEHATNAQLLQKMSGHTVVRQGVTSTLDTNNLEIENLQHDWRDKLTSFLTDPGIMYLLMLIAIYGLFFEFSNPGMVVPGIVGLVAMILVLYTFQLMPINYAGLTLILIGMAFMVFEVCVSTFGVVGVGGIVAFILGSMMLFDVQDPAYRLTWPIITSMSLITFVFFFIILNIAIRSHKKAIVTGKEGLIDQEGIVLSIMNEQVVVRVMGEIWDAQSSVMLKTGQKIKVVGVKGLVLFVEPL